MGAEYVSQVISREVKRAVSESGLSVREAARQMGVGHETVYRWMRGEIVPPIERLHDLARVTRTAIHVRVGHEEAAPDVPGRLDEIERKLDEVLSAQQQVATSATARIIEALAPPARLAQAVELIERLEQLLPPLDAASPEETESVDPAAGSPPSRAAE